MKQRKSWGNSCPSVVVSGRRIFIMYAHNALVILFYSTDCTLSLDNAKSVNLRCEVTIFLELACLNSMFEHVTGGPSSIFKCLFAPLTGNRIAITVKIFPRLRTRHTWSAACIKTVASFWFEFTRSSFNHVISQTTFFHVFIHDFFKMGTRC